MRTQCLRHRARARGEGKAFVEASIYFGSADSAGLDAGFVRVGGPDLPAGIKKMCNDRLPKGGRSGGIGSHEGASAALEKEVDCEAQKYGLAGGYRLPALRVTQGTTQSDKPFRLDRESIVPSRGSGWYGKSFGRLRIASRRLK